MHRERSAASTSQRLASVLSTPELRCAGKDFFLARYRKHVSPVADTFAYCLLRNHFHVLVRIKPIEDWPDAKAPERRFGDFFNGYAKAFNKAYDRTGSLFQKRFGRVEISTPEQLEHRQMP